MAITYSLVLSLVAIAVLSVFMVISIDKVSLEVNNRIRKNAYQAINEYNDAINEKSNALLDLSKTEVNKEQVVISEPNKVDKQKVNVFHQNSAQLFNSLEKRETSADVYKFIRNNYDINIEDVAQKLNSIPYEKNSEVSLMKSILEKITPQEFMELDTLKPSDQAQLLMEYLDRDEVEVIKNMNLFGIDLYSKLKQIVELKEVHREFLVSNEVDKKELEKHNIKAKVADNLVEGMVAIVDDKVYDYGIDRKELRI